MSETANKILFCTDFSQNALQSFSYAIRATKEIPDAQLVLFHTMPEPDAQFWKGYILDSDDAIAEMKQKIHEKIDAEYRPLLPPDCPMEVVLTTGDAPEEILHYANRENVRMIVLGRQGSGMISQWLMGNVTARVVRKANCPVLVVPFSFIEKQKQAK